MNEEVSNFLQINLSEKIGTSLLAKHKQTIADL